MAVWPIVVAAAAEADVVVVAAETVGVVVDVAADGVAAVERRSCRSSATGCVTGRWARKLSAE